MIQPEPLRQAASLWRSAPGAVALTGAGVSVESGLPDFRSAGGIWSRYEVGEYATIHAFRRNPGKVWNFVSELLDSYAGVQPNPGHRALAELERQSWLQGVITQNIDGLHQAAGSRRVVEFHGSLRRLVCISCGKMRDAAAVLADPAARPPRCECQRILKPDFIFFGEAIPSEALELSSRLVRQCPVLLVAGTSAEVAPASQLPYLAKAAGAAIIELNLERTWLTGELTDVFLQGPFSLVMSRLAEAVLDGGPPPALP